MAQTSRGVGYALAWLEEGRGSMPKKSRIERLKQKRPQVLVVELVRQSGHRIRQALPESEYGVIELSSPNAGRRQLTLGLPALAFISTVHGPDAMYAFCRDVARRGVPVIVLQDAPTKASVIQAARCGAVAVMVAPPSQEKISPRVRQLLDKKKDVADKGPRKPEEVPKLTFPEGMKSPRARVEFVVMKAQTLLALPHAVSAVLRICSEPGSSAADLVAPIQTDSAISASVFRLVNSAAMSGRHRVTDLRNAVARLGTKATSNLATAQSVFKMFDQKGDTFGFDRTEYWIHSLGVACCARALAGVGNKVDPDDAFLAGLLHDFGKMVLDEYVPTEYQEAVKHANIEGVPVREGEQHVFDVEHAYVGRKITGQWGLPDRLVQAVANHHHYDVLLKDADPAEPEGFQALALAQITCLANQLAKAFGFGHAGDLPSSTRPWQCGTSSMAPSWTSRTCMTALARISASSSSRSRSPRKMSDWSWRTPAPSGCWCGCRNASRVSARLSRRSSYGAAIRPLPGQHWNNWVRKTARLYSASRAFRALPTM